MFFSLKKKSTKLALISGTQNTFLVERKKSAGRPPVLKLLSMTENSLDVESTLPTVLEGIPKVNGDISITLPIDMFETLQLSIPKTPDEAVAKVLPFHLAKNLSAPLNTFIYDWQITARHQETLGITIYLYPVDSFQRMSRELAQHNLKVKFFDADVFAAFAYLEEEKRLPETEAVMCALIWFDTVSFAVFEKELITLVRSVRISQPGTPLAGSSQSPAAETPSPQESSTIAWPEDDGHSDIVLEREESDSILSDFNLIQAEEEQGESLQMDLWEEATGSAPTVFGDDEEGEDLPVEDVPATEWDAYIQEISLEVMRTKDYYSTVVKGSPIKTVLTAGDEIIHEKLSEEISQSVDIQVQPISAADLVLQCPPLFQIIGMGATATR